MKGLKRSGDMWIREEDTFMPSHFDVTGDGFEIDHLMAALAFCPGRTLAVDVGAHYGSWARHLARHFERVEAFEPVAETYRCLEANTREFSNINIHNRAVGERAGSVAVGKGKRFTHPGMETIIGEGPIPLVRLDDLGLPPVDFLKIDVEGYELQVLHGARALLERDRPVVIFEENIRGPLEHNVENGSCARYLEGLGAELVQTINKDFVFRWR